MDGRERFKVAVLALCADQGMSLGETLVLVKHANQTLQKQAVTGQAGKSMWPVALKTMLYGGLFAPPAIGGLAGWGAARATSGINESTSEEVKHREIIDELRRQSALARSQSSAARQRHAQESQRGSRLL